MSETPQHVYPKASVGEQSANVAPNPDFPQLEQDVLRYWDTNGTFQKSIDENPSGEHSSNEFVFFDLSLIHISEPTRLRRISYAVFCLKKKKKPK